MMIVFLTLNLRILLLEQCRNFRIRTREAVQTFFIYLSNSFELLYYDSRIFSNCGRPSTPFRLFIIQNEFVIHSYHADQQSLFISISAQLHLKALGEP